MRSPIPPFRTTPASLTVYIRKGPGAQRVVTKR